MDRVGVRFTNAYNGRASEPLLHAASVPPEPLGQGAGVYFAACGTIVRNVTRVEFAATGPGRRCGKCITATRGAAT